MNRTPALHLPPILWDDESMVAFDKPAGLPVVADAHAKGPASLMAMVRERFGADTATVHRLDPDASGVILCARNKVALDFLSGQFQSKTADRRYVALVVLLPAEQALPAAAHVRGPDGALPDSFTVDLPMVDDQHAPGQLRVGKGRGSREGVTEFTIRERFGRFALMECRPLTGRTHPLRVHLAAVGAPALNDTLYGDPGIKLLLSDLKRGYKGRDEERPLLTRLALHAGAVTVRHPSTKEPVTITAPLPEEFEIALKYLRKFSPRR